MDILDQLIVESKFTPKDKTAIKNYFNTFGINNFKNELEGLIKFANKRLSDTNSDPQGAHDFSTFVYQKVKPEYNHFIRCKLICDSVIAPDKVKE